MLFHKLPFVRKLDNPATENVVNGNDADDLSVQKFLLATDLLQYSVQESLNMIVTDGDFNNASIRRVLDTKYPSVMKKPNPIDFVLKDKAKFDIQNPVIGSLYEQIRKNKKDEFARKLLKLPTTDAQKETKSTFEKIADFSRKIRKTMIILILMMIMMMMMMMSILMLLLLEVVLHLLLLKVDLKNSFMILML